MSTRIGAYARGSAQRIRARIRWTIRLRLTLAYGALFLVGGTLLLALTYALVTRTGLVSVDLPAVLTPSAPSAPPAPGALPGTIPAPPPDGIDELNRRLQQQRDAELRGLATASGFALLAMTFASVGLGWLMAGRALRPLRAMAGTAREISERNLHRRLGVRGPRDEIKALADTFDGLLERLEGAFEAQRHFAANASHELRTPLTLTRGLLEVALAAPDATAQDLRETCQRVLASNQDEERLIEALLTLARSQRGLDRRAELDVAALAAGRLRAAQPLAELRRCRIEAEFGPAWTEGDAALVERLIGNLLDNAVRHNVPDGWVRVRTYAEYGRPTLQVVNSGPLIPPDQVGPLFQPFRGLDADRGGGERGGPGLGLSIVAAIVAAHGAELRAYPPPEGGLDIRIGFRPAAADSDRPPGCRGAEDQVPRSSGVSTRR